MRTVCTAKWENGARVIEKISVRIAGSRVQLKAEAKKLFVGLLYEDVRDAGRGRRDRELVITGISRVVSRAQCSAGICFITLCFAQSMKATHFLFSHPLCLWTSFWARTSF
jgi:hypothetical protein